MDTQHTARQLLASLLDLAVDLMPLTATPAGDADSSDGERDAVEANLERQRQRLTELQETSRHLDQQLLDRQLAHIDIEARTDAVGKLAADLTDSIRRARADLVARTDELSELARQIASSDEHLRALNLRIVDDTQTLEDLHHDLDEARRRITQHRQLLAGLRAQLDTRSTTSASYRASIDQSRAELNGSLHTLADVAAQVEQITDLVETDDLTAQAASELGKLVEDLHGTVSQVGEMAGQLADIAKSTASDGDVSVDDLMLHLLTTVTDQLERIGQRVTSVLDLQGRLSAIQSDPDASPYVDPTGGRVEGRDEFLAELRDRAQALSDRHQPAGMFDPLPAGEAPADDGRGGDIGRLWPETQEATSDEPSSTP